jgi:hypothetical protein
VKCGPPREMSRVRSAIVEISLKPRSRSEAYDVPRYVQRIVRRRAAFHRIDELPVCSNQTHTQPFLTRLRASAKSLSDRHQLVRVVGCLVACVKASDSVAFAPLSFRRKEESLTTDFCHTYGSDFPGRDSSLRRNDKGAVV